MTEKEERDLLQLHMDKLNSEILPHVDLGRLDRSCNSQDTGYAAEVLKRLHESFVEVYGTDDLDSNYGFVCAPAVIQGRPAGRLSVGLVFLDAGSSGEHYNSYFFTPLGVIDDGFKDNTQKADAYLKEHFKGYDYWYTVNIERDHHVNFDRFPDAVADILDQVHAELHPGMEMK